MMQQRSISLDIFKVFLSILIIAVHIQPLFETRNLLEWQIGAGLARIPVPCFFIINGYFLSRKITDAKTVKKYLVHLFIIYITWSLFYLYFYYPNTGISNIVLNLVMGYHHLWYLPALFLGVILLFFLRKVFKKDLYLLIFVSCLFLVAHLDDVSQIIPHFILGDKASFFSIYTYRNGLFMGLPFITFGYLISKWHAQKYFKSWHLMIIVVISLTTLLIESYYGFENRISRDLYFSILFLCPALIMLILKYPYSVNKSIFTEYLGYLPNGIYYIHVFFIFKLYSVNNNIYNIPAVFLSSALATIVLTFINRRLPVKIFL